MGRPPLLPFDDFTGAQKASVARADNRIAMRFVYEYHDDDGYCPWSIWPARL
jgi:nuclear transport factor 2 (NTF2) superfamily protein